MNPIAGLTATGRRLHGPAADLVELISETGYRYTAIQFHPEYRDHPAINSALAVVLGYLESPLVTGLVELKAHDREQGAFVYPTGQAWSVAEINRTYADFGEAPGVRAGLELMYAAGEILIDAAATGEAHGVYSHGGLTPWRVLLKPDGQAQIIGYALPQVEILRFHQDPQAIPREDSFRYCPPERLESAAEDLSSDLFALALVAFELMTGKPVYDGLVNDIRAMASRAEGSRRLFRFREQIPRGVQELLKVCLRREVPGRFPDGAAFMEALTAALGSPEAQGPSLMDVMERVQKVPQRQGTPLQDGGATMMVTRDKLAAMIGEDLGDAPARQAWKPPTRKRRVAPRAQGEADEGAEGEGSVAAGEAEAPAPPPAPSPAPPAAPEPVPPAVEALGSSGAGDGVPKWRRPARRPPGDALVDAAEPPPPPAVDPAAPPSAAGIPRRAASLASSIVGGERRPPPVRRLPPRTLGSLDDPARIEPTPAPPDLAASGAGADRVPARLPSRRPPPETVPSVEAVEPVLPPPPAAPPTVPGRTPNRPPASAEPREGGGRPEASSATAPPPAPAPVRQPIPEPGPTVSTVPREVQPVQPPAARETRPPASPPAPPPDAAPGRASLDEPRPASFSSAGRRIPDALATDGAKGEPRLYRLLFGGKERRFRLPVDQPVSEAVAKLVGTLLPLRLDATGRLTGWYRLAQGGQRPPGNPAMGAFDDQQPIDLVLVESRIAQVSVQVQGEAGPISLRLAVGTAIPAAALLDHMCELLSLPAGRWRLTLGGRALQPHELLDDCGPVEDLNLVVER